MTETEIILGSPGCGKTTALLQIVEQELERGVAPDKIAFVTFTRRGAEEAITRACKKFDLTPKSLPYFKTLHSLCYRQLGLCTSDVFDGKVVQEFADYAGIRITGRWSEDGTLTGFELGDRALFIDNLARVRCRELRAEYDAQNDNIPWSEVSRISTALKAFKKARGLLDYTDMLYEFVNSGININLDVVICDEVQDNSLLQWKVFDKLRESTHRTVVGGDDDQAIYQWAGADADYLVDLPGKVNVLGQSWRVPPLVQELANRIITPIKHRRQKTWKARDAEGGVNYARRFDEVSTNEQWADNVQPVLILARNTYVLREQVEPALKRQGIIYERNGHNSINTKKLASITAWEALRKGESISIDEARSIYELMSAGVGVARGHKKLPAFTSSTTLEGLPPAQALAFEGNSRVGEHERGENSQTSKTVNLSDLKEKGGLLTDAIWHEALDRLPREEMSYILAARRRGEKLRAKPRVRVSTIHAAKGGEAQHVVILKEMAKRTFSEMERSPDDERRVFYVAVTRAREKLTIVESWTKLECPWL